MSGGEAGGNERTGILLVDPHTSDREPLWLGHDAWPFDSDEAKQLRKQLKPEIDRFEHEWLRPRVRWSRDGRRFAYSQTDRGHQRFRVIDVDAQSGAVRNLIDEKTDTFIWTAHTENVGVVVSPSITGGGVRTKVLEFDT